MPIIDYLIIYAFSFSGVHYKYGGNNPLDGLDCSGYVSELLKASGVIGYNMDASAKDIYNILSVSSLGTKLAKPQAGAISFYGTKDHITHVGFCVNEKMMLSAAGGSETTLTKDDARLASAYVKLRPIKYRKDFFVAIMPNY